MTNRITNKDLDFAVKRLNIEMKTPLEYRDSETREINVGHYHIDSAYGGVKLVQTVNDGGGIRAISTGGYGTKRELYNTINAMLNLMRD